MLAIDWFNLIIAKANIKQTDSRLYISYSWDEKILPETGELRLGSYQQGWVFPENEAWQVTGQRATWWHLGILASGHPGHLTRSSDLRHIPYFMLL